MKNNFLSALILFFVLILSGCSKGNDGDSISIYEPQPVYERTTIYESTGCWVNDADILMTLQGVVIADDGFRYLTGSVDIKGIETFWIAKFQADGECVWEYMQNPAMAESDSGARGQRMLFLTNGNIVLTCLKFGSALEEIPTMVNVNSGAVKFVKVKDGFTETLAYRYDDFFIWEGKYLPDPQSNATHPWTVQISNSGEIIRSEESLNLPGLGEILFLDTDNYIIALSNFVGRTALSASKNSYVWEFDIPEGMSASKIEKVEETVIVTFKYKSDSMDFYRCQLDIESGSDHKLIYNVQLDKENLEIQLNDTYSFQYSYLPEDAPSPALVWKSSDESVATINQVGLLSAKKEGKCTITLEYPLYIDVFARCEVEVIAPINDIKFEITDVELMVDEEYQMIYKLYPIGAIHNITWESANSDIATVDSNGKITALKSGQTAIRASINGGERTATCVVRVLTIEQFIGSGFTVSGSGSIVNGYANGVIGGLFINKSSKQVILQQLIVVDDFTFVVSIVDLNGIAVEPGKTHTQNITFNRTYKPVLKWTYKYNDKSYIKWFSLY